MTGRLGLTALTLTAGIAPGRSIAQTPYLKVYQDPLVQGPATVSPGTFPDRRRPIDADREAGHPLEPATTARPDGDLPSAIKRAWYGETVPGGGMLSPMAFMCPAGINGRGRIAFFAQVNGSARNQGIFAADKNGLTAIAIGCGGEGGSGDPGTGCGDATPVGGTFSGFFPGTTFAPDINESGDVLFMADVAHGVSRRGLFLYRAASRKIVTVAALGDPSPLGGTFQGVGPGSLNNRGEVVFLANGTGARSSDIFLWKGGAVSKYVAVGDGVPGGGEFAMLGTEALGFADGTYIPIGPVPDINDLGMVAFRGITTGALAERGLFLSKGGSHEWFVRAGDATPAGGAYIDFWAPILNDACDIAFLADYSAAPEQTSSGWFVGSSSSVRKALSFYDPVDGGMAMGLAVSRNPMQPLDDEGNLLMWTSVERQDGTTQEELVESSPGGHLTVMSRQGETTPLGGTIGSIQAWPSLRNGRATLSAGTPGAINGVLNAHMLLMKGAGLPSRTLSARRRTAESQ